MHTDHPAGDEVEFEIAIELLDPELPIPTYAKPGDAGADLFARVEVELAPGGGRGLVPTGIAIAIPPGYAGFIQPRSGLAAKHGVTCLNSPGLIDSGYRGEISVLLINLDPQNAHLIERGDRIAQLVIQKVERASFLIGVPLASSERGTGGFGHTGR